MLFAIYQDDEKLSCLGVKVVRDVELEVNFADIYALNFIDWGLVYLCPPSSAEGSVLDRTSEVIHATHSGHLLILG